MGIQRLNKKGLQLRQGFYALIVVSMVAIAIGITMGEWSREYNSGISYDLDQDFNRLDSTYNTAKGQQSRLSPENTDPTGDFEDDTFRGAYGILNTIFSGFEVVIGDNGMIAAAGKRLKVDQWAIQGLIAISVISIIFAVIAAIFRKPGGKV